ncbi:hypothetical protein PENSPDRAFT_457705 [Peniophora sp. CONT]|nr:hypothetical protein PENSPDRAFT_457705 [Peniophora sp. CONT]
MVFGPSLRAVSTNLYCRLSSPSFLLATRCLSQPTRQISAYRFISSAPKPGSSRSFGRRVGIQIKHPRGKSCSSCGAQETSRWHNDPGEMDAKLCSICYGRMKRDRDNLMGRVCLDCGREKSFRWHRHPNNREASRSKLSQCLEG